MGITRRQLLAGAGVAAGAAVAAGATVARPEIGKEAEPSLLVDRVVRTTCSPNCTGSCGQLAFVRDGKIVKIQQAADYRDPAYSPRGCMKGLSYHLQIYGPDRVTAPLIFVAPPREGRLTATAGHPAGGGSNVPGARGGAFLRFG